MSYSIVLDHQVLDILSEHSLRKDMRRCQKTQRCHERTGGRWTLLRLEPEPVLYSGCFTAHCLESGLDVSLFI
jgi:hypothetical protein